MAGIFIYSHAFNCPKKKPAKVWLVVSSIMEVEFLAVVFIQKTEENVTVLTAMIVDGMLATISLIAFLLFEITTL